MFKNYGNTCFINCILYSFYYSSALNSLLCLKEKQLAKKKKEQNLISIMLNAIHDEKKLPKLITYLSKQVPSYSYGQQFDAHEFLIFVLDHLKSDWYSALVESEQICDSCQTVKSNTTTTNWTLLYDTQSSFSDALMRLNREIVDLNCDACGSSTRHLKNIKISPALMWCFTFPNFQSKSQNVLLPTEFEYHTKSERFTYCLVSVVVHITLKKDVGHYITFVHNDKKVLKTKLKKSKSLESLNNSRSLDSIRNSLSSVDISCTYSNKAKFIKCDDDEVTDLTGTELYKHLANPSHHLYLVWYQMIDKQKIL